MVGPEGFGIVLSEFTPVFLFAMLSRFHLGQQFPVDVSGIEISEVGHGDSGIWTGLLLVRSGSLAQ